MDREEYEKELKKIQEEHLKKVRGMQQLEDWKPCMHDACSQCHGTGVKLDGTKCVHMISCDCPKCRNYYL